MNKTQWGIVFALVAVAALAVVSNPQAVTKGYASLFSKGSLALLTAGKFLVFWVAGLVALLVLADFAPEMAGWIGGLILVGAILTRGPAALANLHLGASASPGKGGGAGSSF